MPISKLGHTTDQPVPGGMSLAIFAGRLLVTLIVAALAVALWQLTDILVLLFGAVLLSIGLCAAARLMALHTGIRRGIALACVVLLVLCVLSCWCCVPSPRPCGSSAPPSLARWTT